MKISDVLAWCVNYPGGHITLEKTFVADLCRLALRQNELKPAEPRPAVLQQIKGYGNGYMARPKSLI